MRQRMLPVAAVVGAALAFAGVSGAQAPAQDSVVLTGGPAIAGSFTVTSLNVTSGPSGENPTGQVSYGAFGVMPVSRPVTCLAVRGNAATINISVPLSRPPPFDVGIVTVAVVDNAPDSFDATVVGRAPTDCSPTPPIVFGGPLTSGDITVVDARPSPTSKADCRTGGWRNFPGFRNRRECIRSVRRQARQACVSERAAIGRPAFRAKYGNGNHERRPVRGCIKAQIGG
ncbi:MAG: hypothetical protein QOK00_1399 [Thermoleophilaceae bacterium]|nr:hypothetical protein [Thermoleophilaceae bacterium]